LTGVFGEEVFDALTVSGEFLAAVTLVNGGV
jgi:hypothetical protein